MNGKIYFLYVVFYIVLSSVDSVLPIKFTGARRERRTRTISEWNLFTGKREYLKHSSTLTVTSTDNIKISYRWNGICLQRRVQIFETQSWLWWYRFKIHTKIHSRDSQYIYGNVGCTNGVSKYDRSNPILASVIFLPDKFLTCIFRTFNSLSTRLFQVCIFYIQNHDKFVYNRLNLRNDACYWEYAVFKQTVLEDRLSYVI